MTELFIDLSPVVLGGNPMFAGTRFPAPALIDHVEATDRLDGSLDDYPTVTASESRHSLFRGSPAPHAPYSEAPCCLRTPGNPRGFNARGQEGVPSVRLSG